MKLPYLVIFDETFVLTNRFRRKVRSAGEVYLLPLSTDPCILKRVEDGLKQEGLNYIVLKSGLLINQSAENIREQYLELIARLPEKVQYKGQWLKEYLALDEKASMWWFSLVEEKNTLKSNAFSVLCRFDAIIQVLQQKEIRFVCFGSSDGKLKGVLRDYLCKKKIGLMLMKTRSRKPWKEFVRDFQNVFLIKHMLFLIEFVFSYGYRIYQIKKYIPEGGCIKENSLLFLTYYPAFNMSAAENGIFQNKYCFPLQKALQKQEEDIQWLAISVNNEHISLKDSLKYTKKFNENGNNIAYWEKFCTFRIQWQAFKKIFQMGVRFFRLENHIAEAMSLENYNIYKIFRDDWFASFAGKDGYYNLLFYYSWQGALRVYQPKRIFYYCEMQGWEKTLILANQAQNKPAELIAYQHATVSPMLLSYFNRPSEFMDKRYPLPQPDKLVCNGQKPYTDMINSGWPKEKLMIAEAIRYDHLKKNMGSVKLKKKIVLLALPINVQESGALLNVVKQALTPLNNVQVWIKPHPFLMIEKVFQYVQFNKEDFHFTVRQEPIEELLAQVKVMIGSQSGVSFEALAYGCEVVIVNTPEQINMSPLKNVQSDLIWHAQTIQEVRNIILNILDREIDVKNSLEEAKRIIDDYFYLNPSSDQPDRLLAILLENACAASV